MLRVMVCAALLVERFCELKVRLVGLSDTAGMGGAVTNVAITFCAWLMLIRQLSVPVQAPLHPLKMLPAAGVALSVTLVPLLSLALQVAPQLIPAGLLLIVPEPVPDVAMLSKYMGGAVGSVTESIQAASDPPETNWSLI